ncbi:MAG: exodeoxyribonuclease VII large subunit [Anaerolineales bacterium]|nr:exodeoxyribonuclease VII large subunit [Anaerolineales bacterium]
MNLPLFGRAEFGSETWTVTDLNRYVRQQLESDFRLQDVRVRGEVSGFRAYPSGHWYFSLKDANAQVNCVMWRSRVNHQRYTPRDGDAVEVSGSVTLYEARGQYQLDVTGLQPQGEGALYREFMQLKARLEAEGLFDSTRKRPLPPRPRRIGLVTSPAGAALRDMLNILRRRLPLAEVILAPTLVQGPEAPAQIVTALQALAQLMPDVIILARGGGSLEDLWAFNDERVARALAAMPVPTISGVGHETDFTIADFVADVRAPTPSAAAELVSAVSVDDLRAQVDAAFDRLVLALSEMLSARRAALNEQRAHLRRLSPVLQLRLARRRASELQARAAVAIRHQLELARERHNRLVQILSAVGPPAVLQRGYAIVRKPRGVIVRSVNDVQPGEALTVHVSDGEFGVEVTTR